MTSSPTLLTVLAGDLRPGDVRIDVETGERMHACFDVQHGMLLDGDWTQVWTALSDQDRDEPADYLIPSDLPVVIERKAVGPVVTRTTLTLHEDGSVAIS